MENELETKKVEMIFDRQYNIFNPEEQTLKLVVVGCGSTGSFILLTLAKLGFKNITAIDFDVVSTTNIPHQLYRISDISKPKVEAIKEIIKDFSGLEITAINKKVDEENKFVDMAGIDLNTLVIMCLDNIPTRELIYNEVKDMPIKILDTRVGEQGSSIHLINLESEKDKKKYEKLLKMPMSEEVCGNKFIIYNLLYVASETCNIVKRLDKGEKVPTILRRNMTNYTILNDFS